MIFQPGEGRLTAVSYSVCTGEGGGLFYVKDDALIYQTLLFHQETMNLQPLIMQITVIKQYMECTSSPWKKLPRGGVIPPCSSDLQSTSAQGMTKGDI
jgi:hypothetical protein